MPPDAPGEREVAEAVADPASSLSEISRLITQLPAGGGAGDLRQTWLDLVADRDAEDWRRLAAIEVLLDRHVEYPQPLEGFLRTALEPLGIGSGEVRDMTIAQNLPIERVPGENVRMALLPISTEVGPAAVYFAVGTGDARVQRAAVYPRVEQLVH
jgi:hypothetical protein